MHWSHLSNIFEMGGANVEGGGYPRFFVFIDSPFMCRSVDATTFLLIEAAPPLRFREL